MLVRCLAEYDAKLESLSPTTLPPPRRCSKYHCEFKPSCYTNTRPHYHPNYTLSELVVGQTNWTFLPEELGYWSLTYGYLDTRPYWVADRGSDSGEIHFKISIGSTDVLYICGQGIKESLLHAVFHLDPNISSSELLAYKPTSRRVPWTHKKYYQDECKILSHLPVGKHVLSVGTNVSFPNHQTVISHIIFWT